MSEKNFRQSSDPRRPSGYHMLDIDGIQMSGSSILLPWLLSFHLPETQEIIAARAPLRQGKSSSTASLPAIERFDTKSDTL